MATGIGGHSPADLPRYLEGLDFPARRLEIIRHAHQHHADPDMIETLEEIPDQEYRSLEEVIEKYSQH